MQVRLDIPAGDKQKMFLEYLNSHMRRKLEGYNGHAYYEEGKIFNILKGVLRSDGNVNQPFEVKFMQDENGVLRYAEFSENHVEKFINDVILAAFSENKSVYYTNLNYFYVGPVFDGEYWINDTRISPVFPEEEHPFLIAERVISIETNILAIDQIDAHALATERAANIIARLSLLLDIGFYKGDHIKRWVIPEIGVDGVAPPSVRLQTGFHGHGVVRHEMPKKGELCREGGWADAVSSKQRNQLEYIKFPRGIKKILRYFSEAEIDISKAFDGAARMYQVSLSLRRSYPTVALAYRAASVEAASYGSAYRGKFKNFMRNYCDSNEKNSFSIDYLYERIRNSHFHAGIFAGGEYSKPRINDLYFDDYYFKESSIPYFCMEITRVAIIRWVLEISRDEKNNVSSNLSS